MRLLLEIALVIGIGIMLISMVSCAPAPDPLWRGVQQVECKKGLAKC